ncbi:TlpA family protein disulfide reductase [Streptomyces sp. NPDC086549]|uniref:TlpA family protein disulfide reductase n=1 Tax=Streptomyces sp. NPDC086549 TaxID=3365752 RepID=UPI0037FA1F0D
MTTYLRSCAAVAVLCAILAGCSTPVPIGDTTSSDPLTQTMKEGERPVAPDFSGTTLEGHTAHLSDYRGKVVLVNAWASWCGPCRIEAPELKKIQQTWKSRGVQVFGLDNDKSRAAGLAFQQDHHLGYPSVHDPSGRQALKLPHGLVNPQFLPFTIVIDPAGKIAAARMGQVTETGMEKIIAPLLTATGRKPGHS